MDLYFSLFPTDITWGILLYLDRKDYVKISSSGLVNNIFNNPRFCRCRSDRDYRDLTYDEVLNLLLCNNNENDQSHKWRIPGFVERWINHLPNRDKIPSLAFDKSTSILRKIIDCGDAYQAMFRVDNIINGSELIKYIRSVPFPLSYFPISVGGHSQNVIFHMFLFILKRCPSDYHLLDKFLDHGFDIDCRHNFSYYHDSPGGEQTLLTYCCRHNCISGINYLLSHGANIEEIDTDNRDFVGKTPLVNAILFNNSKIITILLEKGANVNHRCRGGITPLMIAISTKRVQIIEILLSHGADVNLVDINGDTALTKAHLRYPLIIKLLIKYGAV